MPKYEVTPEVAADFEKRFKYHAPFGDQAQRYEGIRADGRLLAQTLTRNCPPSRELSLALTNLEQALFWANASIARNEKPE
jgi:hypothetical protein